MKTRYLYLLRYVLAISDIFIVNVAFFWAFYITDPQIFNASQYQQYLLLINLFWIVGASFNQLYHLQTVRNVERIYRATFKAVVIHAVILIFYFAFTKDVDFSRQFVILLYLIMSCSFVFSRFVGTGVDLILKRYFKIRKSVAVLGTSSMSLKLADFFEKNSNHFSFEGFLNEDENLCVDEVGNVVPNAAEQIRVAAKNGIKEVYVALTPDRMPIAKELFHEAEKRCIRLKFVPDLGPAIATPFSLEYVDEFPIISLRKEPLDDVENRFQKRLFDIAISSLIVIFVLSWLFPIIALLIKLESPGPVLFKQLRSGKNNRSFWCYKFRSMKVNSVSDVKQATKGDDRISDVGAFLRKTSLDELPQFFNVLFGDMSVVGPRPHMLKHTEEYSVLINQFMVRHFLKPGITGWAQVNGLRGETKDTYQMEKRVEHDIWYLENWSVMLDAKIFFMTIINMLKGDDKAY